MTTELADHIHTIRMVDTHEHVVSESVYVDDGPDILMALFNNYVRTDLVVAGAAPQAVENVTDQTMDLAGRETGGGEDALELAHHLIKGDSQHMGLLFVRISLSLTRPAVRGKVCYNKARSP